MKVAIGIIRAPYSYDASPTLNYVQSIQRATSRVRYAQLSMPKRVNNDDSMQNSNNAPKLKVNAREHRS